jgi:hypothetical protein
MRVVIFLKPHETTVKYKESDLAWCVTMVVHVCLVKEGGGGGKKKAIIEGQDKFTIS